MYIHVATFSDTCHAQNTRYTPQVWMSSPLTCHRLCAGSCVACAYYQFVVFCCRLVLFVCPWLLLLIRVKHKIRMWMESINFCRVAWEGVLSFLEGKHYASRYVFNSLHVSIPLNIFQRVPPAITNSAKSDISSIQIISIAECLIKNWRDISPQTKASIAMHP